MKKEDLIKALGEIDDDLLAAAQAQRMKSPAKKPYMRKTFIGILGMAAVLAVFAVLLSPSRQDTGQTPVLSNSGRNQPVETEQTELKKIVLSHHLVNAGSAGLCIEMYPDLSKEPDYNPWNEGLDLKTLPVFERIPSDTGIPYGLSESRIQKNLDEYKTYFGFISDRTEVSHVSDIHKGSEDSTVYMITAYGENGYLSSNGYGEIFLNLNKNGEIALPEGVTLSRNASEEEAQKTVQYLYEQYGALLGSDAWGYDIGGDYSFDGRQIRTYRLYGKAKDDENTILNYNFRQIIFSGSDDGTHLSMIRIQNETEAYENAGEYPLITLDEAYEQLYEGNYFANTNGVLIDRETEIGDVQLVYLNWRSFRYSFPCYLFKADITFKTKSFMPNLPGGLKAYGLYFVPALETSYIEWSDEAVIDDPVFAETIGKPDQSDPAETTEPVIENVDSSSAEIVLNRYIQKEGYYCTAACAQMILDHFGISTQQDSLARQMNTYKPGECADGIVGTYDTDAAYVLNEYLFGVQPENVMDAGYRVQPVSTYFDQNEFDIFVRRMKRNIDDGYPSIIQIRVNSLYGSGTSSNHNVLVSGYANTDDGYVLTLTDPYYSGTEGNGISMMDATHVFTSIVESKEPSYIW